MEDQLPAFDYAARNTEMRRLRTEEHWLLQALGEKYGISRERVRQIVGATRKSRAKRPAPVGEIELAPTETAPDGGGNAQSAGVRPTLPHGGAVDRAPVGAAWKRVTAARPVRYCKCGMALPSHVLAKCPECGRPTA
jgi:hypothetical protein